VAQLGLFDDYQPRANSEQLMTVLDLLTDVKKASSGLPGRESSAAGR
jgi:DNA polymerase V